MKKKISILIIILLGGFIIWKLNLLEFLSLENISIVQMRIKELGFMGPIIFVLLYITATVFFIPGLPLTLVSALAFGPFLGSVYVSIASVCGATAAFIISRILGRDLILKKLGDNEIFSKIDEGVKREGWKMLMITRVIPLFPFNVQNYVYGLTDMKLGTYIFVSWIFMLPGTFAYVFLAGSILSGQGDIKKTITYITIGGVFLIGLILLQKLYKNRTASKN